MKAQKVRLRAKLMRSGKWCLLLDYYPMVTHPKTGKKTRWEYLGLAVRTLETDSGEIVRKGKKIKVNRPKIGKDGRMKCRSETDRETLRLAYLIQERKQNELNKPLVYTEAEKEMAEMREKSESDFVGYFVGLTNKRKGSDRDIWQCALERLEDYMEELDMDSIQFKDVNLRFCEGFREFLRTSKSRRGGKLSANTAASYFSKFRMCLIHAWRHGYLKTDVTAELKGIKKEKTRREYLELSEVKRLMDTPCRSDVVRRAALFSILTGLRFSDIHKLRWREIISGDGGYSLKMRIQKTGEIGDMPISADAVELCGVRGDPESLVFAGLGGDYWTNQVVAEWIKAAGIEKKITFHCFRHTFATLQLGASTDITTIKEMMGHSDIKTTMIYLKILKEKEREAAEKIKLFT